MRRPDLPAFWNPGKYRKMEKTVGKHDTGFLLDYADVAGTAMAQAFADYRKEAPEESLTELGEALMTLSAIVVALQERRVA